MATQLTRAEFLSLGLAAAGATLGGMRVARATTDKLAIVQSEPLRSMDPANETAVMTSGVLAPMYEGLTRYDEKFQVAPGLATAWTADPTGKEWKFTLRPGVKFHDGTACDAAAVAYSFQRHLDVKRGLASSGRFRGVIASVDAPDASTVHFSLKTPYPAFTRLLAIVNAGIVSPTADKAGELEHKAVGTGPFRFVEWASADHVSQARNESYWGEKPALAALTWSWTTEPSVMNMSVRSQQADIANPFPPVFAGTLANAPDLTLMQANGSAVFWVSLNTKLKPLDDVRVRQAINYATDRAALVASLLHGYGVAANSPLAPVTQYFDPTISGYAYDIDKAKALLKEAGYPDGISINVAVQEPQANIAEALQGMWSNAGIKLDVQKMESGVWVHAAFGNPEQKAKDKVYSVLASWASGAIDADLQFRPLYDTASWSPGGANLGFYSNPKLDGILDQASSTLDSAKRATLYAEAQRIVVEDAPHVLLYVPKDLVAMRNDVKGVWLVPGGQVMVAGARRG
jgi:glutathione transport system substrate-binding protein